MEKKYNFIITILLSISILSIICYLAYDFVENKEQKLYEEKYLNISINTKNKIDMLIKEKENAILTASLSLIYKNENIEKFILQNSKFDLKDLSAQLKEVTNFKNIWFQIINKKGESIYRSWTDDKNDDIRSIRTDLKKIFENPQISNAISIGRYGITIKSTIPIRKDNEFIGVFETISHFNSITEILKNEDNVDTIILVDKRFYEQLKDKSITKRFLNKQYIANENADVNLVNYISTLNTDFLNLTDDYIVRDDCLIINYYIEGEQGRLANFLVLKNLNSIDTSDIKEFRKNVIIYISMLIILICSMFSLVYYYFYTKSLKKLNDRIDRNKEKLRLMNLSLRQTIENEIQRSSEKNRILFQQTKMAAMGEMLENIAHQWRQPLSLITTEASSIKVKKHYGELTQEEELNSLQSIIDTAKYLSTTVDDFRDYFLPDKAKSRFYSKDIIEKCLKLFNHDIKNNEIKIVRIIEKFEINSYENEFIQVIINLINNAKDELLKIEPEDRYIFIEFHKIDNLGKLIIKDSAGGVDKEIIDRIFEPYFTTKHKSQGTGIGLYMCEEIIKRHINGKICVRNTKFEYKDKSYSGAQFEISIPIE